MSTGGPWTLNGVSAASCSNVVQVAGSGPAGSGHGGWVGSWCGASASCSGTSLPPCGALRLGLRPGVASLMLPTGGSARERPSPGVLVAGRADGGGAPSTPRARRAARHCGVVGMAFRPCWRNLRPLTLPGGHRDPLGWAVRGVPAWSRFDMRHCDVVDSEEGLHVGLALEAREARSARLGHERAVHGSFTAP